MLNPLKNEIGGYFGFELTQNGQFPYKDAYFFNSARSAFFVLIKKIGIKSIFMPKFICNSIIEPLNLLNVNIKYYQLDKDFYPILKKEEVGNDYIFYVNYFGVCTHNQERLMSEFNIKQLIFDNSQAFFVSAFKGVNTIYSPRKFLPIADGGILVTEHAISLDDYNMDNQDDMYEISSYQHLFLRLLYGANRGYPGFIETESLFSSYMAKPISLITKQILETLDYQILKQKRLDNFKILHEGLKGYNQLSFDIESIQSPLTYPLFIQNKKKFTEYLIKNKVYSPSFWKDSLVRLGQEEIEYDFVNHITHLVCDHRYDEADMLYQISLIKEVL